MKNWIAPDTNLIPDFIIGGAMKCGTSTLHQILNKHPKVFIPTHEIGFFDIDNILQHSDFNFYANNQWIYQSMDKDPKVMWDWYQDKFRGKETLLKGEDSTTYLSSRLAAERIAMQNKEIKLIFLLRQPSMRAYSNYYHLLRSGRASHSFEDTLRFDPFQVVSRSLYKECLEHYYKCLPKSNIKVILFEDFIANKKATIEELCTFLGLDYAAFPEGALDTHANKVRVPKNISLQAKRNLLLRNFGNMRYNEGLPFKAPFEKHTNSIFARALNKLHKKVNPQTATVTPKINPATKAFLDHYFYNELQGIDQLIDRPAMSKWFPDS